MGSRRSPAGQLEVFLNFIDECGREYQYASQQVREEDKRLQDLLHEMEFASGQSERNRVATRLQHSRRYRRGNKDVMKRNEKVVKFFEEPRHRDTLNHMRQLLGQQRKEEEYLLSERIYKPRVADRKMQR